MQYQATPGFDLSRVAIGGRTAAEPSEYVRTVFPFTFDGTLLDDPVEPLDPFVDGRED
jgi:hypothetical protein